MDELTKALAEFFTEQRKRARHTIEAAASMLDISLAELELFEQGKAPIPSALIFAMANVYNADPDVVLELIRRFQPGAKPSG